MKAGASAFDTNVMVYSMISFSQISSTQPHINNAGTRFLATTTIGPAGPYTWLNSNGTTPCTNAPSGVPPFEIKQPAYQACAYSNDPWLLGVV